MGRLGQTEWCSVLPETDSIHLLLASRYMTKKEMRKLEKKQQKEEERLVGVRCSLCVH